MRPLLNAMLAHHTTRKCTRLITAKSFMRKSLTLNLALPVLALVSVCGALAQCQAQAERPRFWIAGRYDGNRVIIYFDTVRFNNTVPPNAPRVVEPVAGGFFLPVKLPASYIANFLMEPNALCPRSSTSSI